MNPNLEKIYNHITADLAGAMFKLLHDYPGHEPEICRLMAAQLGSFIAVTAKDPAQALIFYANRLAQFDWPTVRSDYFANTLGVTNTRAANNPLCEVHSIGDRSRDSVRPEDSGAHSSGDPAAKKPE